MLAARFAIPSLREHAFTLIELLIVLSIISIMTAVAVLSFGDFGASRKNMLILQQFKSSMQAARLESILTSSALELTVNNTGYFYHAEHFMSFPKNTSIQLNTKHIYFLSDGTVSPFTLEITFNHSKPYHVIANESGEVNIE